MEFVKVIGDSEIKFRLEIFELTEEELEYSEEGSVMLTDGNISLDDLYLGATKVIHEFHNPRVCFDVVRGNKSYSVDALLSGIASTETAKWLEEDFYATKIQSNTHFVVLYMLAIALSAIADETNSELPERYYGILKDMNFS